MQNQDITTQNATLLQMISNLKDIKSKLAKPAGKNFCVGEEIPPPEI